MKNILLSFIICLSFSLFCMDDTDPHKLKVEAKFNDQIIGIPSYIANQIEPVEAYLSEKSGTGFSCLDQKENNNNTISLPLKEYSVEDYQHSIEFKKNSKIENVENLSQSTVENILNFSNYCGFSTKDEKENEQSLTKKLYHYLLKHSFASFDTQKLQEITKNFEHSIENILENYPKLELQEVYCYGSKRQKSTNGEIIIYHNSDYNCEIDLSNKGLTSLKGIEDLVKKVKESINPNNQPIILKIFSQFFKNRFYVRKLNLSDNLLTSVNLKDLSKNFPELENLNLQNNCIRSFNFDDYNFITSINLSDNKVFEILPKSLLKKYPTIELHPTGARPYLLYFSNNYINEKDLELIKKTTNPNFFMYNKWSLISIPIVLGLSYFLYEYLHEKAISILNAIKEIENTKEVLVNQEFEQLTSYLTQKDYHNKKEELENNWSLDHPFTYNTIKGLTKNKVERDYNFSYPEPTSSEAIAINAMENIKFFGYSLLGALCAIKAYEFQFELPGLVPFLCSSPNIEIPCANNNNKQVPTTYQTTCQKQKKSFLSSIIGYALSLLQNITE